MLIDFSFEGSRCCKLSTVIHRRRQVVRDREETRLSRVLARKAGRDAAGGSEEHPEAAAARGSPEQPGAARSSAESAVRSPQFTSGSRRRWRRPGRWRARGPTTACAAPRPARRACVTRAGRRRPAPRRRRAAPGPSGPAPPWTGGTRCPRRTRRPAR